MVKTVTQRIDEIMDSYQGSRANLISILQDLQAEFHWLSPEILTYVAQKMGVSLTELFGVVTFYRSFRLKPRGKHLITVCMGTACHVRGAPRILDEMKRQLGIEEGGTTPDLEHSLETAACFGCCALAPCLVINGKVESKMTSNKVKGLLAKGR